VRPWLLLCLLAVSANATTNRQWAVELERPGLPNLHKVSDVLYRGAQPTEDGFRELKGMGIKTVVNLRSFHTDSGKLNGLTGEHLWVKAWHPEDKEVVRILQLVTNTNSTPIFVHCQHGADRTGTMCAIYRVAVQGWTKEEAIEEMTKGNFGYHKIWVNLIRYIRELDIDAIKKRVGENKP